MHLVKRNCINLVSAQWFHGGISMNLPISKYYIGPTREGVAVEVNN